MAVSIDFSSTSCVKYSTPLGGGASGGRDAGCVPGASRVVAAAPAATFAKPPAAAAPATEADKNSRRFIGVLPLARWRARSLRNTKRIQLRVPDGELQAYRLA